MQHNYSRDVHAAVIVIALVAVITPALGDEPNDDFASANPISCLHVQTNEVVGQTDVDYYRIDGAPLAQVSIDIDAAEWGSGLDSYLGVFDSDQWLLTFSDDDPAPGELPTLDSYLSVTVPSDGILYIAVTRYGDADFDGVGGSDWGAYIMHVVCAGVEDPNEPNDAFADATALDCPFSVNEVLSIDPLGDRDFFVIHGFPGNVASVDVDAHDLDSPLDPTLAAYEDVGGGTYQLLAFSDNHTPPAGPTSLDPLLELPFPDSGDLYLSVQAQDGADPDDIGDTAGVYHLVVRCVSPPGALLGTTAAARTLIDIDPATGESLSRVDHSGIVTDLEFGGGFFWSRALLGAVAGAGRIVEIDPVTGAETLFCDHEPGLLGALEYIGTTLYASLAPTINDPSSLVVVEFPDFWNCAITHLAPTGFGALGGLAYHESQGVLYGCVGAGAGAGDLVVCDPLDNPACRSVGPTGFDSCGALTLGPDGTLYGGVSNIGGGSADSGKLFTIDPATGRGTEIGPTGYPSLSGLAFVPPEGDWSEPNDDWLSPTPIACDSVLSMAIEPLNDVDFYYLTHTPGMWVLADVDALEWDSSLDSVVGAFDDGFQLDYSGVSMTPGELLSEDGSLQVMVPSDGFLTIAVASENDFDFLGINGQTIGPYELNVHCLGATPCLLPPEISGSGWPLLQVHHGESPQQAELVFPNPGRWYATHVLGVDIEHNGFSLRATPGVTPAEKLQQRLTYLGSVDENLFDETLFFVDEVYHLEPGEIVGYLAMTESLCDGTFGPLGPRRGSADLDDLWFPTGSTFLRCTCDDGNVVDACYGIECAVANTPPFICFRTCQRTYGVTWQAWECTPGGCGRGTSRKTRSSL